MGDFEDRIESVLDDYKCPSCHGHIFLKAAIIEANKADTPMFLSIGELLGDVAKVHGTTYDRVERSLRNLITKWYPLLKGFLFDIRPTNRQLVAKFYMLVIEDQELEDETEEDDMLFSIYPKLYG